MVFQHRQSGTAHCHTHPPATARERSNPLLPADINVCHVKQCQKHISMKVEGHLLRQQEATEHSDEAEEQLER